MAATSSVNIEIAKIDAAKAITVALVQGKTFPFEGPTRDLTIISVCTIYKEVWKAINDPKQDEEE